MAMKDLENAMRTLLDQLEWTYEFNEEKNYFDSYVSLDSSLERARVIIDIVDDQLLQCYTILPLRVPEKKRAAMAEYITRANYGFKIGNFKMDYSDGEVRFHTYLFCPDDFIPTRRMLRNFLFVGAATMDQYGEGFGRVLFSDVAPALAIAQAEADDDDDEEAVEIAPVEKKEIVS